MTKKDYQAIAGALYRATRPEDPRVYERRGETVARVVSVLADVLAADNPRFDRDTFVAACEDGNVGRRPKRKRRVGVWRQSTDMSLPLCAQAMGCYCAGHARGNAASEPCDTREET